MGHLKDSLIRKVADDGDYKQRLIGLLPTATGQRREMILQRLKGMGWTPPPPAPAAPPVDKVAERKARMAARKKEMMDAWNKENPTYSKDVQEAVKEAVAPPSYPSILGPSPSPAVNPPKQPAPKQPAPKQPAAPMEKKASEGGYLVRALIRKTAAEPDLTYNPHPDSVKASEYEWQRKHGRPVNGWYELPKDRNLLRALPPYPRAATSEANPKGLSPSAAKARADAAWKERSTEAVKLVKHLKAIRAAHRRAAGVNVQED